MIQLSTLLCVNLLSLLFIFYTLHLFFVLFFLPSFGLIEYYYILSQLHFGSLIIHPCFILSVVTLWLKYASLTYLQILQPFMYDIRTLEQYPFIPSLVLHAVIRHFNKNLIQDIFSSGFVPSPFPISSMCKVLIFNILTNPLELSHF